MREHPMLFSAPMVRALMREVDPETVTRRLITPHSAYFGSAPKLFWEHANFDQAWIDGKGSPEEYLHVPCHRGDASELVRLDKIWGDRGQPNGYRDQYPDCGPCAVCDHWGWRMTCHRLWARIKPGDRIWNKAAAKGNVSPLFLPRWASRLILEVLSVRAERLQDITEEDARAEGVDMAQFWTEVPGRVAPLMSPDNYRAGFAILWDSINGHRAPWQSNPLVWRYELRRIG